MARRMPPRPIAAHGSQSCHPTVINVNFVHRKLARNGSSPWAASAATAGEHDAGSRRVDRDQGKRSALRLDGLEVERVDRQMRPMTLRFRFEGFETPNRIDKARALMLSCASRQERDERS
jgi:hypothetical protein